MGLVTLRTCGDVLAQLQTVMISIVITTIFLKPHSFMSTSFSQKTFPLPAVLIATSKLQLGSGAFSLLPVGWAVELFSPYAFALYLPPLYLIYLEGPFEIQEIVFDLEV